MVSREKMILAATLLLHTLMLTPAILKVTAEICDKFELTPYHIDEYHIPQPNVYEHMWVVSLIVVLYGVYALCFDNVYKLAIFIVGDILFGVLPVTFAIFSHHTSQLFSYHGNGFEFFWYFYSVAALLVHCTSLYYAALLRSSWKSALVARLKSE